MNTITAVGNALQTPKWANTTLSRDAQGNEAVRWRGTSVAVTEGLTLNLQQDAHRNGAEVIETTPLLVCIEYKGDTLTIPLAAGLRVTGVVREQLLSGVSLFDYCLSAIESD